MVGKLQINTYVLEESENRPFSDENCKRQTANVKSGGKIVIASLFRSALSKNESFGKDERQHLSFNAPPIIK